MIEPMEPEPPAEYWQCKICGKDTENDRCDCPVCLVCGDWGNLDCYKPYDQNGHAMTLQQWQIETMEKLKAEQQAIWEAEELEIQDEAQFWMDNPYPKQP